MHNLWLRFLRHTYPFYDIHIPSISLFLYFSFIISMGCLQDTNTLLASHFYLDISQYIDIYEGWAKDANFSDSAIFIEKKTEENLLWAKSEFLWVKTNYSSQSLLPVSVVRNGKAYVRFSRDLFQCLIYTESIQPLPPRHSRCC